ncbi:MAG: hypothetical protein IJ727_00160 [Treponema sp.]|nr:hypothetical protein [Treponema sp.]
MKKKLFAIVAMLGALLFASCSNPMIDDDDDSKDSSSASTSSRMVELVYFQSSYTVGGSTTLAAIPLFFANGQRSYQWYRGTSEDSLEEISGATGSSYTSKETEAGTYYYAVSITETIDDAEPVTTQSKAIKISVSASNVQIPSISSISEGQTVIIGANVSALTVEASVTDGGKLSYQWYRNDTEITDATESTYIPSVNELSEVGTYNYMVKVTNTLGTSSNSTDSGLIVIKVIDVPAPEVSITGTNVKDGSLSLDINAEEETLKAKIANLDESKENIVLDGVSYPCKHSYAWYKDDVLDETAGITYTVLTESEATYKVYVEVTNTVNGHSTSTKSEPVTVVISAPAQAPVISTQPKNTELDADIGARLVVTASVADSGTLSYQWYKLDTEKNISEKIEGATKKAYDAAECGYYYVVVTNTKNGKIASTTSDMVQVYDSSNPLVETSVTVKGAKTYTEGASDITELSVASVTVKGFTATLSANAKYQWYLNGEAIDGATKASYKPDVSKAGDYYYSVSISDTVTYKDANDTEQTATISAKSADVEVTVEQAEKPKVVLSTTKYSYEQGESGTAITSEVTYSNSNAEFTYAWYLDSEEIAGATAATYTPDISKLSAGTHSYYLVVTVKTTGAKGKSLSVSITVAEKKEAPKITSDLPESKELSNGSATLSIQAEGTTPLSYQWYKDSESGLISGATDSSYTAKSAGTYWCVVTNEVDTATSKKCTVSAATPDPVAPVIGSNIETSGKLTSSVTSITLSITASVSDGGSLSYQWYKDSNAISGETNSSYTVTAVGTYYCLATNTLNGKKASTKSSECVVTSDESGTGSIGFDFN